VSSESVIRGSERVVTRAAAKPLLFLAAVPAIALIAKTLATFATIIQPYLAIHYDLRFELGMVIGQVLFQWGVLWRMRRPWSDRLDYALVLIAISGLGAVLLWPLLFWHHRAPVEPFVAVIYFFAVVGVMFVAHWRLVHKARLPLLLCGTWVLYRVFLLVVIVKR
jgi:hypothetical protein